MIGLHLRRAADQHIGIANRLDLLEAMLLRPHVEAREQRTQPRHHVFGLHRRGLGGEADDVSEQDRHTLVAIGDDLRGGISAFLEPVGDGSREDGKEKALGARAGIAEIGLGPGNELAVEQRGNDGKADRADDTGGE